MKQFCVDLEIAKELNENGFPVFTKFWWFTDEFNPNYVFRIYDSSTENEFYDDSGNFVEKNYPAPTSDELLKELPNEILRKYNKQNTIRIEQLQNCNDKGFYYRISYGYEEYSEWHILDKNDCEIKDKKLSNALAKMWLYLKKEGYIK